MIDFTEKNVQNDRERLQSLLDAVREKPGSTVMIPPVVYTLTSQLARQTMQSAIFGEYGENPEDEMFRPNFPFTIGLSLNGHQGTRVEAYGVTLMVDGFMEPVSMDHCSGVTLSGLTIDHLRKPYSRGLIESCERLSPSEKNGSLTVRFADAFPVSERTIMPRYCVYDFHTHRFQLDMKMTGREFLGDQRFRLHMTRMPVEDLTGQEFYIWHSFHFRPAILLEEASDLTLRDVTIHSQPGMGIVGHHCEDILLERLRIIPSHGEHLSTNTDATHFVSCKGKLIFRGCSFKGHGLHLVPGDGGAPGDIQHTGAHAKAFQRIHQLLGVGFQLFLRAGVGLVPRFFKQLNGRILVLIGIHRVGLVHRGRCRGLLGSGRLFHCRCHQRADVLFLHRLAGNADPAVLVGCAAHGNGVFGAHPGGCRRDCRLDPAG